MASPEHSTDRLLLVELRKRFYEKLDKEGSPVEGGFHPADLARLNDDKWPGVFLDYFDLEMKTTLAALWDTCIWRKKQNVNEINETNVRMEYVKEGLIFPYNYDRDGKRMLIFKTKLYLRGTKNMDDMKNLLIYWVERTYRETDLDPLTFVFDMANCGLSNMDMDYTRFIIGLFKNHYPNMLNYILIYDVPWILNATFKIVKGLLPPKAVARLKFVNEKSIKEYVDDDNLLACWGGQDDYTFEFESEHKMMMTVADNDTISSSVITSTNAKLSTPTTMTSTPAAMLAASKKVHFAQTTSSMSSKEVEAGAGKGTLLEIVPHDAIVFQREGNSLSGTVELRSIHQLPITFKIKTTSPTKYRVLPSAGVLAPGADASISVTLHGSQQMASLSRDKFLVMCMELEADSRTSNEGIAELWKNTKSTSAVEQHRLRCTTPVDGGDGYRNGNIMKGEFIDSDRQLDYYSSSFSHLQDTTARLESQLKFNQTLLWIAMLMMLMLAVAIVYILKSEIRNNIPSHCMRN